MDMLSKIRASAGQKRMEDYYGATFIFQNTHYPCSHDGALLNPKLILGGISPDLMITINLRAELFGTDLKQMPMKGGVGVLLPDPANNKVQWNIRVDSAELSVGNTILTLRCNSVNQRV